MFDKWQPPRLVFASGERLLVRFRLDESIRIILIACLDADRGIIAFMENDNLACNNPFSATNLVTNRRFRNLCDRQRTMAFRSTSRQQRKEDQSGGCSFHHHRSVRQYGSQSQFYSTNNSNIMSSNIIRKLYITLRHIQ